TASRGAGGYPRIAGRDRGLTVPFPGAVEAPVKGIELVRAPPGIEPNSDRRADQAREHQCPVETPLETKQVPLEPDNGGGPWCPAWWSAADELAVEPAKIRLAGRT